MPKSKMGMLLFIFIILGQLTFQIEQAAAQSIDLIGTVQLGRGDVRHLVWRSDDDLIAITENRLWHYHIEEQPVLIDWAVIPGNWYRLVYDQSRIGILQLQPILQETTLWVFDVDTLEMETIHIPLDDIRAAAFVPNSSGIVIAGRLPSLWHFDWQLDNLTVLNPETDLPAISALDVSPDGSQIAMGYGYPIRIGIWDWEKKQLTYQLEIENLPVTGANVKDIDFSPDGRFLTTVSTKPDFYGFNSVRVFDLQNLQSVDLETIQYAQRAIYSPNAEWMGTYSRDSIGVWNTYDYTIRFTLPGYQIVSTLAFSPDGDYVAFADWRGLYIAETVSGEITHTIDEHFAGPWDMDFSPDGTRLASIHYDGKVRLWDTATGNLLREVFDYGQRIGSSNIVFDPSGDTLAVSINSQSGGVFLIDVQSGDFIQIFDNPSSTYEGLFTPVNRSFIVAVWSGFQVWDITSGERILWNDYPMGRVSLALSRDGDILAVAHSGSPTSPLRLYETANWDQVVEFGFFTVGTASSIAISSDNTRLASGHCDMVALWDISTLDNLDAESEPDRELPLPNECVEQVAFLTDDVLLVTSNTDTIRLWQIADNTPLYTIPGGRFAFSQDAQKMATTNWGIIQLWDFTY